MKLGEAYEINADTFIRLDRERGIRRPKSHKGDILVFTHAGIGVESEFWVMRMYGPRIQLKKRYDAFDYFILKAI